MENIKTTNLQVVEAWQEIIDQKKFSDLEMVESADIKNVSPSGSFTGIAAHTKMLNAFAKAFPDYQHQNFNYIESGEWIAMEGIFSGTHAGDISMGKVIAAPSFTKVNFPYGGFIKVLNGKVVESRLYYDSKLFLNQLGLD
jgi:predicted ester cyclase